MSRPRLVVVVPSWNCGQWIDRCLHSIDEQRTVDGTMGVRADQVIIVDDGSTEPGYLSKLLKWIRDDWRRGREPYMMGSHPTYVWHGQGGRADLGWSIVRHAENMKMPFSLVSALRHHQGGPEDVVVLVDGDDYLLPHALDVIGSYYDGRPDLWVTWGSYKRDGQWEGWDPNPAMDWPADVKSRGAYRSYGGIPFNHPLTFRRGLFDALVETDLQYDDGRWFEAGYDFALMIPFAEMAGYGRMRFISDVTYVYNEGNPMSDAKIRPEKCGDVHAVVRSRPVKPMLASLR